jgi:hypothetical protein
MGSHLFFSFFGRPLFRGTITRPRLLPNLSKNTARPTPYPVVLPPELLLCLQIALVHKRILGFGPNVAHLDGETEKVQFEKVRNSLSDGETAWFRGLKGRDIPAQGNALGIIGYKDC